MKNKELDRRIREAEKELEILRELFRDARNNLNAKERAIENLKSLKGKEK